MAFVLMGAAAVTAAPTAWKSYADIRRKVAKEGNKALNGVDMLQSQGRKGDNAGIDEPMADFSVEVLRAQNVVPKSVGGPSCDIYVKLQMRNVVRRTRTGHASGNFVIWNSSPFTFHNVKVSDYVKVRLYDKNTFTEDDLLAETVLPLDVLNIGLDCQWIDLALSSLAKKGKKTCES
mmetsp:Transcript_19822/g.55708  ORF Transcript_19822/g.55708 Transcript_19822/m.55708 type:complete len:177 (-) Transcript_19822:3-533(-)